MDMRLELPNLTETQKSFNAMQTNLLSVNSAVNTLQENDKEQDHQLTALNKAVFIGNGELSLKETVRNHEKFISEIKYWIKFAIGLLVAQFISFGVASVVAYIRFLPVLEQLAKKP